METDKTFYTIKAENRQFEEALAFLSEVKKLHFLKKRASAERNLKKVQIAGTNGKGSTAAMLSAILIHSGLKVGLYTSPSLVCVNERVRLNGKMISDDELCTYIPVITEAQENIGRKFGGFERITAAAMLYFLDNNVDIAIMETGLGGRYDTVSAVDALILSSITAVGMDHIKMLGNTIEQIAWEKCGIMRPNVPTVAHSQSEPVEAVINKCAAECNSHVIYTSSCSTLNFMQNGGFQHMDIDIHGEEYSIDIPLDGEYQQINAKNAVLCALSLREQGFSISKNDIEEGLSQSHWEGRLQHVQIPGINANVVLDGAHNPHAMKAVADHITKLFPNKKYTLLMSVMQDKDIDGILSQAARFADKIVCVSTTSRSCSPEQLAEKVIEHGIAAETAYSVYDGLKLADALASDNTIYALGSLYLVGAVLSEQNK